MRSAVCGEIYFTKASATADLLLLAEACFLSPVFDQDYEGSAANLLSEKD